MDILETQLIASAEAKPIGCKWVLGQEKAAKIQVIPQKPWIALEDQGKSTSVNSAKARGSAPPKYHWDAWTRQLSSCHRLPGCCNTSLPWDTIQRQ